MRRWVALLGALALPLASGVPLHDQAANSLQVPADQTVEAFVRDTQSALLALTTAQGAAGRATDKYTFQVRAANATHVLDTMHTILSLVRNHTNVTVEDGEMGEDDEPLEKPRDSADPQTTTIKFVQKQMELARFNARQGLKKLKAWSTNIPETLAGQDELLTNLSTLEKKAISDLVKIEAQLKKTLVTRLEKVVQSQKKTLVKKLEKVAQNEKNAAKGSAAVAPGTTTTTTGGGAEKAMAQTKTKAKADKRRPSKNTKADKRRPAKAARKGMQAKTKAASRQPRKAKALKAKALKAKAAKEKQKKRKT